MIIYVMKNSVALGSRPPFVLNSVTHESAVPSICQCYYSIKSEIQILYWYNVSLMCYIIACLLGL